jgi:hypothetical protein
MPDRASVPLEERLDAAVELLLPDATTLADREELLAAVLWPSGRRETRMPGARLELALPFRGSRF